MAFLILRLIAVSFSSHFLANSCGESNPVIPSRVILAWWRVSITSLITHSSIFITIPPSFRKTFCHITRTHSCILAFLLSVSRSFCYGTHNRSNWKAFLSTYGLPLVYLSQAESIQLRAYIRLLSLPYLFLHRINRSRQKRGKRVYKRFIIIEVSSLHPR